MIYNPNLFNAEDDVEKFLQQLEMKWPEQFGKYSKFYNIATEAIRDYVQAMNEKWEYKYNEEVDNFINLSLNNQPNSWVNTDNLTYKSDSKKILTGYTSQNVAYHFLLQEIDKKIILSKNLYC